jgi:hypothetical protein
MQKRLVKHYYCFKSNLEYYFDIAGLSACLFFLAVINLFVQNDADSHGAENHGADNHDADNHKADNQLY